MSDNIPSQRGPNFDWKREAEHYQTECDKLRDLIRKVEVSADKFEAENAQLKAERAAEIVSNTRTIMSGTAVMRENTALRSALDVAREALEDWEERVKGLAASIERNHIYCSLQGDCTLDCRPLCQALAAFRAGKKEAGNE